MLGCSQKLWESNSGITSFASQRKYSFQWAIQLWVRKNVFWGQRMSIQCCGFAVRSIIVCSQGKRFKKGISEGNFCPSLWFKHDHGGWKVDAWEARATPDHWGRSSLTRYALRGSGKVSPSLHTTPSPLMLETSEHPCVQPCHLWGGLLVVMSPGWYKELLNHFIVHWKLI